MDSIKQLKKEVLNRIHSVNNLADLEVVFKYYLSRKGKISLILRNLKKLPEKEKKLLGKEANDLKKIVLKEIQAKKELLSKESKDMPEKEWIDVSAPGEKIPQGSLHPITQIRGKIEDIFQSMGFSVIEGPEIETEHYNFDALNIPKNHPARDQWDTFWIEEKRKDKLLLRTHTSPVQVRYMEKYNPPIRIIAPGRCFRYEATDASHDVQFHQIEGLMVDKDISLGNLKGVLESFMRKFYREDIKMRWQPSYFPFVEPGLELLMECDVCKGKGCSVCGNGWLEVIPCGMVHPNVFKAVGYISNKWQGFAFGMGLDRLVMMKYKINDIRLLYSGDLRFLKQF